MEEISLPVHCPSIDLVTAEVNTFQSMLKKLSSPSLVTLMQGISYVLACELLLFSHVVIVT